MKPTTDLEVLIRHLAGRKSPNSSGQSPANDLLDRLLNDPTSDETQFLDEIRRKTRTLLDGAATPQPVYENHSATDSGFAVQPTRGAFPRRRVVLGWLFATLIGTAILTLAAATLWSWAEQSADRRSHAMTERILGELRPFSVPKPADGLANEADPGADRHALVRVEANLAALNAKLDTLGRSLEPRPSRVPLDRPLVVNLAAPLASGTEPNSATITADLAAIRRELTSSEAATTRQIQEMRTVLHELNSVARRVLSRPQPAANTNVSGAAIAVAVQALMHNLQHSSAQVRGEAVENLIRIGAPARSALPVLQQRLPQEPDQNVRAAIETAISVLSSN